MTGAELTDEETEEYLERGVYTTREPSSEIVKFMSKGDWRHVRAAVKNIQDCVSEEMKAQKNKLSPGRDEIEGPVDDECRTSTFRAVEIP